LQIRRHPSARIISNPPDLIPSPIFKGTLNDANFIATQQPVRPTEGGTVPGRPAKRRIIKISLSLRCVKSLKQAEKAGKRKSHPPQTGSNLTDQQTVDMLTVQKFPKDAGRGCCETQLNKRYCRGRGGENGGQSWG